MRICANDFCRKIADAQVARQIFFAVILLKLLSFAYFRYQGGEFWRPVTDANLYDAIARGMVVHDSSWGAFLNGLNAKNLYSRSVIAGVIFVVNCTLVPWLLAQICFNNRQRMTAMNWYVLLFIVFYPSMTVFSVDVFREIPMAVLFLLLLLGIGYFLNRSPAQWTLGAATVWLLLLLICGYMLYTLRFYLVVAVFLAIVATYTLGRFRKWWLYVGIYLSVLSVANGVGVFDDLKGPLRLSFAGAGSGYDIDFSQGFFLVNFFQSFLYGVYGFFIYNFLSLTVFVVESIPILILSVYIYANRSCSTKYTIFLILFFFIYASLWVISTDSLGTAVRYRLFNYLAIIIAASLIHQVKLGANLYHQVSVV